MSITGRVEADAKATNTDAVIKYVLAHSKTIKTALANLTDIVLPGDKHIHMEYKKAYQIAVSLGALSEFKKFNFYEKFIFDQHDKPDFWKALEEKNYADVLKAINIYLTEHPDCLDWLKRNGLDFIKMYDKNETSQPITTPIDALCEEEIMGHIGLVVCHLLADEASRYGASPIHFIDNYCSIPPSELGKTNKPKAETTYLAASLNSLWRTASKSASLIYDAGAGVAGFVVKPLNNRP